MMTRCFTAVLIWLAGAVCALAQFGSFGDVPVEINADGNTRFEGGVAIAEDNVQIHYGDYSIYCDYAEYNPDTRDVLLVGNIRLYTPTDLLTGQRALLIWRPSRCVRSSSPAPTIPLCSAPPASALPR